jgi:hypothetical protein
MDRGTGTGYVYPGCRPGEEAREVKKRGNQREQEGHKSERTQYTRGGEGREGPGTDVWGCVASAGNKIGNEGAKGLADALLTNSSLQTLKIGCAYGGRGGEAGHRGVGRESPGSGQGRRGGGRGMRLRGVGWW